MAANPVAISTRHYVKRRELWVVGPSRIIFLLYFHRPQLEACKIYSQCCQNRESNEASAPRIEVRGDDAMPSLLDVCLPEYAHQLI